MTKRQLIDEIISINQTAEPGFLCHFQDEDLREYLEHLQTARVPRMVGDAARYEKYFATARHTPPAEFGLGEPVVSTETDAAERAALLAAAPPVEVAAQASLPKTSVQPAQPVVVEAAAAAKADNADSLAADPVDAEMEEEEAIELAPADEEPTTRRDSVTARIAKAWRQIPTDNDADDSADTQLDVAEEADSGAEDVVATTAEGRASPADSVETDAAKTDELVPVLAAKGGRQEESQDWLF
jgi:hypothetical protein